MRSDNGNGHERKERKVGCTSLADTLQKVGKAGAKKVMTRAMLYVRNIRGVGTPFRFH